jgi:hypothetical protein
MIPQTSEQFALHVTMPAIPRKAVVQAARDVIISDVGKPARHRTSRPVIRGGWGVPETINWARTGQGLHACVREIGTRG